MNILKYVIRGLVICMTLAIVIWGTAQVTEARADNMHQATLLELTSQLEQAQISRLIAESEAQREAQKTLLARAFYGEYREGTAADRDLAWEMKFSAIYNRLEYEHDWSGDFTETMRWGCDGNICQINALAFVGDEALLTDIGQEALAKADALLDALHFGPFVPLHTGHSWATAEAAADNPYFAGKCHVATGPGHLYFADCPES